MKTRPRIVAFDMIGTVFSLDALHARFEVAGLPGAVLEVWFARILRDAFALEVTNVFKPFREVAGATLNELFAERGISADPERIKFILGGFGELAPHSDTERAFQTLRSAAIRIIALTNGGAETTQKLLERATLMTYVDRVVSIDEVQHWKPRADVYLHAAKAMQAEPRDMALVAAHPWDIHGSGRAGLTTGFVARGRRFPSHMERPDVAAEDLTGVAEALVRL